jgi:hypothetical protein
VNRGHRAGVIIATIHQMPPRLPICSGEREEAE